jgi:prevent-host-death family protein
VAEADPQKTFNVHDAKSNLSRLMDRAHAGEEIILAKAGEPWAKLVPYADPASVPRKPGRWPELRNIPMEVWTAPLPESELDAWEGKYSNF